MEKCLISKTVGNAMAGSEDFFHNGKTGRLRGTRISRVWRYYCFINNES